MPSFSCFKEMCDELAYSNTGEIQALTSSSSPSVQFSVRGDGATSISMSTANDSALVVSAATLLPYSGTVLKSQTVVSANSSFYLYKVITFSTSDPGRY
jgi:hypothetical protein